MSYATNLCALMQKRGISSYKLAKEVGVHVSTITNWKDGNSPKIEHLKKVAEFFDVTVDALLFNNDSISDVQ
jgi:transcriptional regulator with XRE-family HTH domain